MHTAISRSFFPAAVLLASLAQAAQAPPDFSKVEVKPIRLADNFYVIDESEVHGGSVSILTGPSGVVMVDTGAEPLAAKVEAAITRLSTQRIRYVLNTHAHVDEVAANEHFGRLGATIVAREQVRETMVHPKAPAGGASLEGRQARQVRPPAIYSKTPGGIRRHAPSFGEHSDEILRDVLHKTAEEIATLRNCGVLL